MTKPDILIVDGHAFSWRRILELRRRQLEAWRTEQLRQLVLFELKEDRRPQAERTAAGRYQQPTLFAVMTAKARDDRDLTLNSPRHALSVAR